ncbi:MAG: hypothetical protein ACE5LV_04325 [Candidatus Aminicenantales bacterium]
MPQERENVIYQKASKCWTCVREAIEEFRWLTQEDQPFSAPRYYWAKNRLREGEGYFQETLKGAKKLLGPVPAYASPDYQKWRDELLEEFRILALSEEYEALCAELREDAFLKERMSPEEIEALCRKHFHTQQEGQRKLANIKVRIILDRLDELLEEARALNKKAAERLSSRS